MSANIVDLTSNTRNTCRGGFKFSSAPLLQSETCYSYFLFFGLLIILLSSLARLQRPAWGRRTENGEYKEAQHRSQRTAAQRRLFSSLSSAQRRGVVEQCANADLRDQPLWSILRSAAPHPLIALTTSTADTEVEGLGRSPLGRSPLIEP